MQPPPAWIRGLLVLTCTGVSFAHGSNDGQKGMGLIMLILIGTVPTAYALNRAVPAHHIQTFIATSEAASKVVDSKASGYNVIGDPRPAVTAYISQHQLNEGTFPVARRADPGHCQAGRRPMARWPKCRRTRSRTPVTTCISPRKRSAF